MKILVQIIRWFTNSGQMAPLRLIRERNQQICALKNILDRESGQDGGGKK